MVLNNNCNSNSNIEAELVGLAGIGIGIEGGSEVDVSEAGGSFSLPFNTNAALAVSTKFFAEMTFLKINKIKHFSWFEFFLEYPSNI